MTKSTYKPSLFRLPSQLLPPAISSNYIIKVIKPLYDILEASTTRFAVYHLHYKKKLRITKATYNFYLYYNSDKLRTIAFVY